MLISFLNKLLAHNQVLGEKVRETKCRIETLYYITWVGFFSLKILSRPTTILYV